MVPCTRLPYDTAHERQYSYSRPSCNLSLGNLSAQVEARGLVGPAPRRLRIPHSLPSAQAQTVHFGGRTIRNPHSRRRPIRAVLRVERARRGNDRAVEHTLARRHGVSARPGVARIDRDEAAIHLRTTPSRPLAINHIRYPHLRLTLVPDPHHTIYGPQSYDDRNCESHSVPCCFSLANVGKSQSTTSQAMLPLVAECAQERS